MNGTALDPRRWKALALLCVTSFMVILDSSIVVVAVPSIERHLAFGAGGVQWVLTAYVITFGGLMLFGGRASDLLGRRRLFMAGIGVFALSSLVCGLAWTGTVLIAARAVQGVSAAVMAPTSLSIVLGLFPEGNERNRALGIYGAMAALGGTAGALLGGPLTDALGWESVFFLNVPVGGLLVALSPVLLPASRGRGLGRGFDVAGAVLITLALGLLVYGVAEAPDYGWTDPRTLGALAGSAALVAAFAIVELRSPAPLVPLRVLRSSSLVGGNLIMLCAGMAAFGQGFVLTQFAQQLLGWSAVQYGVLSGVMPVMAVVGSVVAPRVIARTGVLPVAAASTVFLGVGLAALTGLTLRSTFVHDMLPGLLVFGLGLGAGTVTASIAAVTGVTERDSGLASGINAAAFQIGGAVGVALLSTVATSHAGAAPDPAALAGGFRLALTAAIGFGAAGLAAALTLLRRPALS
jgi:EmrB/QacA subfamily drug resistance transporter